MQFNELTQEVCSRDGGAIKSNIAQTSELVKHTLNVLAEAWKEGRECEVIELLKSREVNSPQQE